MSKVENAYKLFYSSVGQPMGTGAWLEVTQDRINLFADVTEDHQFIHVDPKAAAERSPWSTTIAHGFLTLSLLTHLSSSIPKPREQFDGLVMGVNYGFDKVRFVNPVKVGARIRAHSMVVSVELKDAGSLQVVRAMTVEIEGEKRPALIADWVTRLVYSS
jgi:acyl dehydratase